jgi:hypothetical protein
MLGRCWVGCMYNTLKFVLALVFLNSIHLNLNLLCGSLVLL